MSNVSDPTVFRAMAWNKILAVLKACWPTMIGVPTIDQFGWQKDLGYGAGPEQLDILLCENTAAPAVVFFHGGWWRPGANQGRAFLGADFTFGLDTIENLLVIAQKGLKISKFCKNIEINLASLTNDVNVREDLRSL